MYRIFLLSLSFLSLIFASAQEDNRILMKIDNSPVTVEEFLRVYNKNNTVQTNTDKKSFDEYLDLFINFKLKVLEAENRGLDTLQKFSDEFNKYKDQLTKPYLTDESYNDSLAYEAYLRTKNEVSASHILIKPASEKAEDVKAAYDKIMEARKLILDGNSFESVAKKYSDDPSAKSNGGNLGYFSAFMMVYPFEDATYKTAVGEVSMPFRTNFGYHIVKVHEFRESKGTVRVAHIWVRSPQNFSPAEKDSAKININQAYSELKNGSEFAAVAQKYSDDKGSASNGGELPEFSSGRYIPEFTNAAFSLKNIGDYTEPVLTDYGWHIIKLLKQTPVPPFSELKADYLEKIKKDPRAEIGSLKFIEKLKAEYNFTENQTNLSSMNQWIASKNADIIKSESEIHSPQAVLFSIGDRSVTESDFLSVLAKQLNKKTADISNSSSSIYDKFVTDQVLEYEKSQLESKYPDYKYLLKEYHDGIILFDLTDEMVWTKAMKDTSGFEQFYENNKSNYVWGTRASYVSVVPSADFNNVKGLKKYLKTIVKNDTLPATSQILDEFCSDSIKNCLTVSMKTEEKSDKGILSTVNLKAGTVSTIADGNKTTYLAIQKVLAPTQKALNECRGLVISDFQNQLEKEWIKELRTKYKVEIDQVILANVRATL